ncbi:MAG: SufD family Fe-S cluster assembly protein [Bacteroidales bacterium]|nr:SufD family Fe-S cluster assembly protein [Bacteroidales bacterium]
MSLETKKSAFQNLYTTIDLGENSTINYHNYENINDNSSLINQVIINTSENSNAKSTMSTLNGGKIQNILYAHINKGVNFEAPGYCMPKNNQKIDNLSFITHEKGYSNSNQKFRCVADNNSFSNFYGYVEVEKDCQKVVADQINNNILLSSTAKIESKPQLIINADDVKCSHGSTTGQLNKEAIYYMQTRGISEQSAKNLLIEAFINDIINEIDNKEYGEFLKNKGFNLF